MMEKIFALDELICDGEFVGGSFSIARYHTDCAGIFARMGDLEKVWEHIKIAVNAARAFDGRPETEVRESLLTGTVTLKRSHFDTADTRPLCHIMAESWLADAAFEKVRESAEFQNILKTLWEGETR